MAPLEIRHRSVRPISAKHAQASRFLQQSRRTDRRSPYRSPAACYSVASRPNQRSTIQAAMRSEEHTSELQSLMRISYAVFCLKKKKTYTYNANDDLHDEPSRRTCHSDYLPRQSHKS